MQTLCSVFVQGIVRVGYSPYFLLLWTLGAEAALVTKNLSGRLQFPICSKKEMHKIIKSIHRKEYNHLLKMMVRINIAITILFLRNLFDIHSSINSIILYAAGLYIGTLLTTQYFEYTRHIANYSHDHNRLQRLCQHFLKASSPLHICTKQKVLLLSATSW